MTTSIGQLKKIEESRSHVRRLLTSLQDEMDAIANTSKLDETSEAETVSDFFLAVVFFFEIVFAWQAQMIKSLRNVIETIEGKVSKL